MRILVVLLLITASLLLVAAAIFLIGRQNKIHRYDQQRESNQQPQTSLPTAVVKEQSGTPSARNPANSQQQTAEANSKPFLTHGEWVMSILTAIYVLIAAFGLAGIKKQIQISDKAANAATKSAEATQQQIEDSKAVQAARLTLEVSPIITEIPGQSALVDWQPVITNAGATIATEINVSVDTYDIRGAHGAYGEPQPVAKPVPNPSPTGPSLLSGQSRPYPFKQQIVEWDKALSRESTVISRWTVSYRDIFNRAQVVPFCYHYEARSKTFVRCPPFTQSK